MRSATKALPLAAFLAVAWVLGACGSDAGLGEADTEQRIFVANTESGSVSVIDHATTSVVDTIQVGPEPHGQAPVRTGDRLYVTTEGESGEVIALDTRTGEELWRLDVGGDLNQPALTRDDRFLYAPDLLGGRTVVVDVETEAVVDEVPMVRPSDGEELAALHNTYASHDGRFIYVTSILGEAIARIDVETREIVRLYELSGQPRPAAVTADDRKMYVQLSELHGFVELDLETGEETARIEWPDPGTRPPGYSSEIIPTKVHGIGITPDGEELWAASNLEGSVHVYSLPGLNERAVIEVGTMPNWIAFTEAGSTAYVSNTDPVASQGTVSVIDVSSRRVLDTVEVGQAPKRLHSVDLGP